MNRCDKRTREIAKVAALKLYKLQKDEDLVISPLGPWFQQLHKDLTTYYTASHRGIVYAAVDSTNCIRNVKVGSTLNAIVRTPHYGNDDDMTIYPINRPDSYTPASVDAQSRETLFEY
jgi:hypothetical protein